jgi:hypothetical protein
VKPVDQNKHLQGVRFVEHTPTGRKGAIVRLNYDHTAVVMFTSGVEEILPTYDLRALPKRGYL